MSLLSESIFQVSKTAMSDPYNDSALWNDKPESWIEVLPGVERRIAGHSSTGMIVYYQIKPGSAFPKHNHPHAQFGLVIQGQMTFNVGDKTWNMKKGDSYYIPPGIFHELFTSGNEQIIVVDFFTPERGDYLSAAVAPDA
jgi:quercetin dioxygenase-like cupin family protein